MAATMEVGVCRKSLRREHRPVPLAFPDDLDANFPPRVFVQPSMELAQEIRPETIERLEKQVRFLIRIHDADLAKDAARRNWRRDCPRTLPAWLEDSCTLSGRQEWPQFTRLELGEG